MLEPRSRILLTSLAALGVSLLVSLAVIGGQKSSGRSDLTERATALVRTLKVNAFGRDAGVALDPTDFLRPEDRSSRAAIAGLGKLAEIYRSSDGELEFTKVEILEGGRARTLRARGPAAEPWYGERQLDWIRGADGRWYLDPEGL